MNLPLNEYSTFPLGYSLTGMCKNIDHVSNFSFEKYLLVTIQNS